MNIIACVKSDSASRNPDRAVLIFVSASSLNSLDWSKISSLLIGSIFPSDVPDSSKFSPNMSTFFSEENVIFGCLLFFVLQNLYWISLSNFHGNFGLSADFPSWFFESNSILIQILSESSLVPISLFVFLQQSEKFSIFFSQQTLEYSTAIILSQ